MLKISTCKSQWQSVNLLSSFKYFSHFLSLRLLFPREEISTLSRQASFRRMNSVSTDPRGTVLRLNFSLHAEHTATSLSYVFLLSLHNLILAVRLYDTTDQNQSNAGPKGFSLIQGFL